MRKRRNALLSKPPSRFHYLTRPVDEKLYEGVHTTGDFEIAAAYAIGTTGFVARKQSAYPVVLELDVRGLNFKPDVDAVMQAQSALDASSAKEVLREIKRGKSPRDIADDYNVNTVA